MKHKPDMRKPVGWGKPIAAGDGLLIEGIGHRNFKLRFSSQGTVSRCQRVVNRLSSW